MERSGVPPSVSLSHRSTAAAAVGGFAAERRRVPQICSYGIDQKMQAPAISSKCGQRLSVTFSCDGPN